MLSARRMLIYEAPAGGPSSPQTLYADATDEDVGTPSPSQTGTILRAVYDSSPLHTYDATFHFDVEGEVGIQTFTLARLYFYSISFSHDNEKPPTSADYGIQIYNEGPWEQFAAVASDPATGQFVNYTLDATARGAIYGGSVETGYDTMFRVRNLTSLQDPRFRLWEIAAYENTGGGSIGDWAAYLYLEW